MSNIESPPIDSSGKEQKIAQSFAARHANPAMGFNVVPRWFLTTPFWTSLSGTHRAVILEMYFMVRRVPNRWKDQIDVARGQFVTTRTALAAACGVTDGQAREVLESANRNGIISRENRTWTANGRTNRVTLITWRNFEAYDRPFEQQNQSANQSANQSENQSKRQSKRHNKTEINTEAQTETKDREESLGAVAPGACGPSPASIIPSGAESTTASTESPKTQLPTSTATVDVQAPAATTKAKGRGSQASTRPRLTDNQLKLISHDFWAMVGYLLHGPAAIGIPKEQWSTLPPSPTNWSPKARNPKPDSNASAPMLAAYYWAMVCWARHSRGEVLELPNFGKLVGIVKTLRSRMTQDDLVARIECIGSRWSEILASLAWMNTPPQLNETTIANGKVVERCNVLLRGGTIASKPAASDAAGRQTKVAAEYAYLNERSNRALL